MWCWLFSRFLSFPAFSSACTITFLVTTRHCGCMFLDKAFKMEHSPSTVRSFIHSANKHAKNICGITVNTLDEKHLSNTMWLLLWNYTEEPKKRRYDLSGVIHILHIWYIILWIIMSKLVVCVSDVLGMNFNGYACLLKRNCPGEFCIF